MSARARLAFAAGAPRCDARMAGDHMVLRVGLPGAPGERWLVLRRDEQA